VVHRTIFRNSSLQIVEQTVRFLSPDVAVAHVWTQLKGAESLRGLNVPEMRRAIMTCVLVKEADRWLITAAHNTDIVPVAFPESQELHAWYSGDSARPNQAVSASVVTPVMPRISPSSQVS
jgi:hypothetical protein